jgi:positive regulator of sigma E activity
LCSGCPSFDFCHAELVFGNQKQFVSVHANNKINAKQGDLVEVESSTSVALTMYFFAFVFPIIISAFAYLIFNSVSGRSNILPLLMIAVFVICFIISVLVINRFVKKKATVSIVRIIEESKEEIEGK